MLNGNWDKMRKCFTFSECSYSKISKLTKKNKNETTHQNTKNKVREAANQQTTAYLVGAVE